MPPSRRACAAASPAPTPCASCLRPAPIPPSVSRLLAELGHEVLVANPRKLRLIYQNDSKSDRVDAEYLARVGRLDPALLAPLRRRGAETQADLALLRCRNAPVRARTRLFSHARGTTKSLGARLPACSADSFAAKAGACVPDELRPAPAPVLAVIAGLCAEIRDWSSSHGRRR